MNARRQGGLHHNPGLPYQVRHDRALRRDAVEHGARVPVDGELLNRFREGYRHLAYLQSRIGYSVKPDMPGLKGPEVEALYRRGRAWLAGAELNGSD